MVGAYCHIPVDITRPRGGRTCVPGAAGAYLPRPGAKRALLLIFRVGSTEPHAETTNIQRGAT